MTFNRNAQCCSIDGITLSDNLILAAWHVASSLPELSISRVPGLSAGQTQCLTVCLAKDSLSCPSALQLI